MNDRIRSPQVRLVGADGQQIGIVEAIVSYPGDLPLDQPVQLAPGKASWELRF